MFLSEILFNIRFCYKEITYLDELDEAFTEKYGKQVRDLYVNKYGLNVDTFVYGIIRRSKFTGEFADDCDEIYMEEDGLYYWDGKEYSRFSPIPIKVDGYAIDAEDYKVLSSYGAVNEVTATMDYALWKEGLMELPEDKLSVLTKWTESLEITHIDMMFNTFEMFWEQGFSDYEKLAFSYKDGYLYCNKKLYDLKKVVDLYNLKNISACRRISFYGDRVLALHQESDMDKYMLFFPSKQEVITYTGIRKKTPITTASAEIRKSMLLDTLKEVSNLAS